jgi:hypothetical protein
LHYFKDEIFCTFWIDNEVYSSGYCAGYDETIGSGINNSSAGIAIALRHWDLRRLGASEGEGDMGESYKQFRKDNGEVLILHWLLLVFFVVAPFLVFLAFNPVKHHPHSSADRPIANLPSSRPLPTAKSPDGRTALLMGGRHLYPYSVIPGGVKSVQELRNAIHYDSVVAAHYAGFDVARARITRLDRDRTVYVSYRLGSAVFWTKRPLKLVKGETLVTDGKHEARTRCGNRITETPAAPATPEEPLPEALETPQDPELLVVSNTPLDLPLTPPPTTDIVPPKHAKFFIPPDVPIPWGGGGATSGQPSPAKTPEPATILLLPSGLAAIWLRRKLQKR